jgi:hypothetical protein
MRFQNLRPLGAISLSAACLVSWLAATPASAQTDSSAFDVLPNASTWERVSNLEAWKGAAHWRAVLSPYSLHWRYSDEHSQVWALGVERQYADRWLLGGSYFSNSFSQPSAYVYLGQRYDGIWHTPPLFFQWSAGLMYGYTGKYKHKVPLNFNGFSPGALISLGWQFSPQVSATAHLLGDAGVMFQLAYDFR